METHDARLPTVDLPALAAEILAATGLRLMGGEKGEAVHGHLEYRGGKVIAVLYTEEEETVVDIGAKTRARADVDAGKRLAIAEALSAHKGNLVPPGGIKDTKAPRRG